MPVSTPLDDALLWEQFRQGNADSLGQLMTNHYTSLLHYGTKFNRDTDFIRDCMQDIFVELWNRRATLRPLTTIQVRPYLMTMLRRLLHQQYLRRQKFDFRPVADETDSLLFDLTFSPETQLIEDEKLQVTAGRIRRLLNELPRRSKEAVYLRFYDNLDRAAIAQVMGISEQSVSNLFQEAFRLLRRRVGAEQFWLSLLLYFFF